MKKMKKFSWIFLLALLLPVFTLQQPVFAYDGNVQEHYVIFDESNNVLFEKSDVTVGDYYVTSDYKKYEVIGLNTQLKTGKAKFLKQLTKPKVSISPTPSPIETQNKYIGLYCSHNDESYEPTDGYYTIYGKGGIHDVAKALKNSFTNAGITVSFNETLHLPHDAGAYSRSNVTAKSLLAENPLNALFDVHRDGVSRSFYATTVNGVERSKIRIVVGKANPNMEVNETFALYINAVAQELYPWLISDIYYASGHYNQGLFEKALLFEMGTYLIEKELVLASVEPLVHVINTVLFHTTVDQEGELNIGGTPTEETPLVNDALGDSTSFLQSNGNVNEKWVYVVFASIVVVALLLVTELFLFIYEVFVKKRYLKK